MAGNSRYLQCNWKIWYSLVAGNGIWNDRCCTDYYSFYLYAEVYSGRTDSRICKRLNIMLIIINKGEIKYEYGN